MGGAFWANLPGAPPDPYAETRYVFNMNNSIYGGSSGQSGHAPDSYDVFYGDIYSSSVTIYAGTAFLETSTKLQSANTQHPQPDANAIRAGLKDALDKVKCSAIVNNLLNSVATKKNPRVQHGSVLAMFDSVVRSGGLTRVAPPGSAGHGSPTGSLKKGNAGIFLETTQFGPVDQLSADIKGALGELMHLGGQNAYYTDRDFAEIVHRDFYTLTTSIWPGDPRDTYHKAAMKNPNNISWSYYWHQAVDRLCFSGGTE